MKERLLELDILRGLSIFGMILVITPGDWSHRFSWANHAEWQGYPLSDMIFPCFLFCIGLSMAISFHKPENQNKTNLTLFVKVLKRSILLIFIGLLINGFPFYNIETLRIPGVLQRIALCYMIVGSIWIFLKSKNTRYIEFWLTIVFVIILISYYVLLDYIPIPGIGITGNNPSNSWPAIIDQKVFGVSHLWEYGMSNGKVTYDPEGILASFPASANVLLGLIIGVFYKRNRAFYKATLIIVLGLFLVLFGFLLDHLAIVPVIKKIWTSSFALLSGGFSLLILACIKLLLQYIPKITYPLHPFVVYGSNAILAFAISNILIPVFELSITDRSIRKIGYDFFKGFITDKKWASFSFSITFLIFLYVLLNHLYKKRIFLKI